MCRKIAGMSYGIDLGYQPYRPYMFSFDGKIEVTNTNFEIECWEKGEWINLGKAVAVEKGCPFRIVNKKKVEPPPVCTMIDIEQVKVTA